DDRDHDDRDHDDRDHDDRDHDDRFRALVLATGQLVWTAGPDGLIRGNNAAWSAYIGQNIGQNIATERHWGWREAIHPDDQPHLTQVWTRAMATHASYEAECRIRRYDGVYRSFLLRGVPVFEPNGDVREWVGCCTDITERKQAEAEGITRAHELEAIFEAVADPIAVYDTCGHLVRMNAALRAVLAPLGGPEYTALAPKERAVRLGLCDARGVPFADEALPSPLARLLRGETLGGAEIVELRLRTPDGGTRLLTLSGAPLRAAAGEIIGAVCVYRDVTARHAEEHRATLALGALLRMAETLVLPTPALSEETTATRAVARRLLDLTVSVLDCKRVTLSTFDPVTEVLHPLAVAGLSPEAEAQWWEEQREQQAPLSASPDQEAVARLRAGHIELFDMRQPPYRDLPNPYNANVVLVAPLRVREQLVGLLVLDYGGDEHEYTPDELELAGGVAKLTALAIERERLQGEREVARANELAMRSAKERVDEFVGIANHELKSPLTTARLNLQQLLRQQRKLATATASAGDAARIETLERTLRQVDRLIRLVDDMLDAARAQADKLEIRPTAADLGAITRETVEELRQAWPARTITLDPEDGGQAPMLADPDRIAQVLT
ncbi:MAG: PAS domain S-box protein, partial [Ktedonobacterales bacterium]|nr:PAS domain S-box protein [Ktedonobacterales bacterium]